MTWESIKWHVNFFCGQFWGRFSRFSHATRRLAARRAELLFLLAGAALSRVRRLRRKAENRPKSTKHRSDDASRTRSAEKTRFSRSRTRLGVDFGRLGALPGAPGRPFWRPGAALATLRTLPRRAGDAPGRSSDGSGTPRDRFFTQIARSTGFASIWMPFSDVFRCLFDRSADRFSFVLRL